MKKHLKKIIIGSVINFIALFIIILFTPVTYSASDSISGVYQEGEDSRGKEINDNVTILFDGEFYKKNKLWNTDMEFIGTVSIEFEEHPEMNFKMESQNLFFYYQGDGMYRYTIDFQNKMYDCVNAIYLRKEWNQMYYCFEIDHNWEEYVAWWNQEETEFDEIEEHEYMWAHIGAPAVNTDEFNECVKKAHGSE